MKNLHSHILSANKKPVLYEAYTNEILWDDLHISKKMLQFHLSDSSEAASRNKEFIKKSVLFIIKELSLKQGDSVIDFGCGPGLYTHLLAQNKLNVTGVDISSNSLEYAKVMANKDKLDITYIKQNYLLFSPTIIYDAALLIYCDYCALNISQRKKLLANIYKSLKLGGDFFFDVFSLVAYEKREDITRFGRNLMDNFWSKNDYFCFANSFTYEKEKVYLDKYEIIEKNKRFTIYNWLKYFTVEEIKKELLDANFLVTKIYSDVAGKPYNSHEPVIALHCQKK